MNPIATILIVDDDPRLTRLLKRLVEKDGHRVHIQETGAEALAWLSANPIDLMVLDFRLRDMTGAHLIAVAGDDDEINGLMSRFQGGDQVRTGHVSEPEVQHHQVDRVCGQPGQ
ncbi:MAG: response regulator, partial [Myxococcota bacterium]